MPTRLAILDKLVELRLRADANPNLEILYRSEWIDARLSGDEPEYIDRQVQLRRAAARATDDTRTGLVNLPTSVVIEAFRGATPLARLYLHINNSNNDWTSNERTPRKAYIFSCFSELAYLHLAQHELPGHDRYKLFPSFVLREFIRHNIRLDVRSIFSSVGDIPVEVIETRWFVYLVMKTTRFAVVAVRGTVSLEDWGINLNALRTGAKNGGFHKGFYGEASAVLHRLEKVVEQMAGRSTLLYFTGHSLGGAVAATLARIWTGGNPAMTPYLYASPRFAGLATVQASPPHGYVAPDDLVPHLPPKWLGFADAGLPPELVPPDRRQLSGIGALMQWLTPGRGFAAPHAIEHYRRNLGQGLQELFPVTVYIDALANQMLVTAGD